MHHLAVIIFPHAEPTYIPRLAFDQSPSAQQQNALTRACAVGVRQFPAAVSYIHVLGAHILDLIPSFLFMPLLLFFSVQTLFLLFLISFMCDV